MNKDGNNTERNRRNEVIEIKLTHLEELFYRVVYNHQWSVDQVNDAVLDRNISFYDFGHHDAASMLGVTD